MLSLSLRDRDRLSVLRQVDAGLVPPWRGAERLGLSRRQFRRLRRRFEAEGDAAVIHRHRGRRPNNAKPRAFKARVLKRAAQTVYHGFGPTLLAEHLGRDPRIGPISPYTLRGWLIEAGQWKVRSRKARHRQARPRRAALGELIQLDTSDHAWLEDRYPGRLGLIKAVDDATNRLLLARFVVRETGAANRQLILDYLERYGRPLALYTDRAGHFGNARRHASRIPPELREAEETTSLIRRALEALSIELILAHSPQAKGRIERDFGTSQDRLVKELRVAKVSTLEAANRFLEDVYIPFWNQRFAKPPADPTDAHRPLPDGVDLQRLFAETVERTIANDFTIRYDNQKLQIREQEADGIRPKQKITVEQRLDGSTRFRWRERYLTLQPVGTFWPRGPQYSMPRRAAPNSRAVAPKRQPSSGNGRRPPPRPGPDHPWKKYPIRVGRALHSPTFATTSTPKP